MPQAAQYALHQTPHVWFGDTANVCVCEPKGNGKRRACLGSFVSLRYCLGGFRAQSLDPLCGWRITIRKCKCFAHQPWCCSPVCVYTTMRDAPTLSAALTALLLMDSSLDKYGLPWYSLLLLSLLLIMPCLMPQQHNTDVRLACIVRTTQGRAAHTACLLLTLTAQRCCFCSSLLRWLKYQSTKLSAHCAC